MENQHREMRGYRDLTQAEIDQINTIKDNEAKLADLWFTIGYGDVDGREMSLARTHFEQAFMHFVKAIARPDSPWA